MVDSIFLSFFLRRQQALDQRSNTAPFHVHILDRRISTNIVWHAPLSEFVEPREEMRGADHYGAMFEPTSSSNKSSQRRETAVYSIHLSAHSFAFSLACRDLPRVQSTS